MCEHMHIVKTHNVDFFINLNIWILRNGIMLSFRGWYNTCLLEEHLKAQADNCSSFDRKLLFFCFSMCVSNFIIKNA
jgi:hypothetical protein